jgi:hypothetical protein
MAALTKEKVSLKQYIHLWCAACLQQVGNHLLQSSFASFFEMDVPAWQRGQ